MLAITHIHNMCTIIVMLAITHIHNSKALKRHEHINRADAMKGWACRPPGPLLYKLISSVIQ